MTTVQLHGMPNSIRGGTPGAQVGLADLHVGHQTWREQANCATVGPEPFYVDKGGSNREAKMVCAACPVRQECLDYAMANDERHGLWGGLSERERHRLRTDPDWQPPQPRLCDECDHWYMARPGKRYCQNQCRANAARRKAAA